MLTIPWTLSSMFLQKKMEKHAPTKTEFNKLLTLNDEPLISKAIRKSIKIRNKIHKQYCTKKDQEKKDFYINSLKEMDNIVVLTRIS